MRIYRVYTSRNFSHATSMEIHQSQKKKERRKYGKYFYSYNPDVSNVEQKYLKNYPDIW